MYFYGFLTFFTKVYFLNYFSVEIRILLLFVFNIYVLVVVITVISSVRRVITNDQRLTEYSRLYNSNTFLSIDRNTSNGPFHYRDNFYVSQFSQCSDLFFQILVLFHFFFFFLYSYISGYSNINNYPLLFFLVNNYKVSSPCLYKIVALDIYVPQYFNLFILYCSFRSMLISLFTVF